MLDGKTYKSSKFRTKNLVEINNASKRTYSTETQIWSKTTLTRSCLWNYSDPHTLIKRTIRITEAGPDAAARKAEKINKQVIFKNCVPITNCKWNKQH